MLEKAKKQARTAIESLYDSKCTIWSYEKYKDPITRETKTGLNPIPKYEDQYCRVSKQSLSKNNQGEVINKVAYEIKLFIGPEIEIRQGDIIEISKSEITEKYKAGEGFKYTNHQEVILTKQDKA